MQSRDNILLSSWEHASKKLDILILEFILIKRGRMVFEVLIATSAAKRISENIAVIYSEIVVKMCVPVR